MKTLRLEIRGRVQGVSYRAAIVEQARALGVHGWVRNRRDGSVEAMLQAPAETLDRLVAWARTGPPAAKVTAVDVFPGEGDYKAFEQRPTV